MFTEQRLPALCVAAPRARVSEAGRRLAPPQQPARPYTACCCSRVRGDERTRAKRRK